MYNFRFMRKKDVDVDYALVNWIYFLKGDYRAVNQTVYCE